LLVYPNPAGDYVNINITGNTEQNVHFVIMNTMGVKIIEKTLIAGNSLYRLDVEKLKQGLYFYNAILEKSNESIDNGKLIISR
jgi:hypothetical protein